VLVDLPVPRSKGIGVTPILMNCSLWPFIFVSLRMASKVLEYDRAGCKHMLECASSTGHGLDDHNRSSATGHGLDDRSGLGDRPRARQPATGSASVTGSATGFHKLDDQPQARPPRPGGGLVVFGGRGPGSEAGTVAAFRQSQRSGHGASTGLSRVICPCPGRRSATPIAWFNAVPLAPRDPS